MQHPSAEQGRKGFTLMVTQWQADKCMETVPQQQIAALSCITNTISGRRRAYSYCNKEVSRTSKEGETEKRWGSEQVIKTESRTASHCKSSQTTSPNARKTGLI